MVEAKKSPRNRRRKAKPPYKGHLSKYFELASKDMKKDGYGLQTLRDYQFEAVKDVIRGRPVFIVAPTGSGKTDPAKASLHWSVARGLVGVYLVPHVQLLDEKARQVEAFFTDANGQQIARVIKLSGESRPSRADLQMHDQGLIICATYEAFRAFLFQIRDRQYFKRKRCFGFVVVDEVHKIGDPERGARLESLLYMLRDEYRARLCCLSATFKFIDAEIWADRLDCKLIYRDPARAFPYEEVLKTLTKKHYENPDEYREALGEKMDLVVAKVKEFVDAHLNVDFSNLEKGQPRVPRVTPAKMLVFCHSRNLAELMAKRINERNIQPFRYYEIEEQFNCEFVHAGVARAKQPQIVQRFNEPEGIQILCTSPLLETGMHIENVRGIIITDPERYAAIQLMQMCGRMRKTDQKPGETFPRVIFLVPDESKTQSKGSKYEDEEDLSFLRSVFEELDYYDRYLFYRITMDLNYPPSVDPDKLIPVDPNKCIPGLEIQGFHLETLTSQIRSKEMPRIVLEALFRRQPLKNLLTTRYLRRYEKIMYDLDAILDELRGRIRRREGKETEFGGAIQLVRAPKNRDGHYSLTFAGEAVVETGITLGLVKRFINFIRSQELISALSSLCKFLNGNDRADNDSKPLNKKFNKMYKEFIAREITAEFAPRGSEARKKNVYEFAKRYDAKNLPKNKHYRSEYKIGKGDEELIHRIGAWITSSLYVLYCGYKLHQKALQDEVTQYFQTELDSYLSKDRQRLVRMIHRFQRKGEKRPRKPRLRARSFYTPNSQYASPVLEILKERGSEGATIREIQQSLEKKSLAREYAIAPSSIHSVLNGTLKNQVYKELEYSPALNRPPHRYWLHKHRPKLSSQDRCKDCYFFVNDPATRLSGTEIKSLCKRKNGNEEWVRQPRSRLQAACPDFQRRSANRLTCADLEIAQGKVRCPACGKWGTIDAPDFQHVTICTSCQFLFQQTRSKRYVGNQLADESSLAGRRRRNPKTGLPYIELDKRPQTVLLKQGWVLTVDLRKKSGVPILKTRYLGEHQRSYLPQEVWRVVLAGGILDPNNAEFLTGFLQNRGIKIEQQDPERILELAEQQVEANQLREALGQLDASARLEKARDLVFAKIRSNVYHTYKLGAILPQDILQRLVERPYPRKEAVRELALSQYDQVLSACFALREEGESNPAHCLNRLRSREASAEAVIWDVTKMGLPYEFRFSGRQSHRYAKTALFWGAKAYDRFNAALNYLYYKLELLASKKLEEAGFSRTYPGPGILHYKQEKEEKKHEPAHFFGREPAKIITKKNREFTFDFMDAYRPPFRYHLMLAFLWGKINGKDFNWGKDEWNRAIHYPNQWGREKLDFLFEEICAKEFIYRDATSSLLSIMGQAARDLRTFVETGTDDHVPFVAYEAGDRELQRIIDQDFQHVQTIADYAPITKPIRSKSSKRHLPRQIIPINTENTIIITHNDWDGFASALLLMIKYYQNRPNLHVIVAENDERHPFFYQRVLEEQVPRLLVEEARNVVIVADFHFQVEIGYFKNLKRKYLEELDGATDCLRMVWYDHHPTPLTSPDALRNLVGVDVHHSAIKDAYLLIWDELQRELDISKKNIHKHPWKLYTSLSMHAGGRLAIALESEFIEDHNYLDGWFRWFKAFWKVTSRRPKNWTKLFAYACQLKQAPTPPPEMKPSFEDSVIHGSVHLTRSAQPFIALIFNRPYPINKVRQALEERDIPIPAFGVYDWYDRSRSLRAYDKSIDLSVVFADQGVHGVHERTGPIYTPHRPVCRLQSGTVERYWPFDEMVASFTQSDMTGDPADLFYKDLIHVKKQEDPVFTKAWERWQSEEAQAERERLQAIYASATPQDTIPPLETPISDELLASVVTTFKEKMPPQSNGTLPIQLESGDVLELPLGAITLLYSEWRHQQALNNYLHYFIHSCLQRFKVLYVNTTYPTLKVADLIAYSTPVPEIVSNLQFIKITDYKVLERFVRTDLRDLVFQLGIKVIIIDSPFKLVAQHLSKKFEHSSQFHAMASNTGTRFLESLRKLVKDLGISIILTQRSTRVSSDGEVLPGIYPKMQNYAHYKLYFKRTRRKYHLKWQKGMMGHIWFNPSVKRHPREVRLEDLTLPKKNTPLKLREGLHLEFPKVEKPFETVTTVYGLKFGVVRLKRSTYNIDQVLANYPGTRAFDLILWPAPPDVPPEERPYSIYNSQVDLHLLGDRYGGWHVQRGMRFAPTLPSGAFNAYFRPFDEFLQVLRVQFLEFRQLVDYLQRIRDDLRSYRQPSVTLNLQRYDTARVKTLYGKIRAILHPFPSNEPWMVAQCWSDIIQELLTCFSWDQTDDIATIILNGLLDLYNYEDEDALDAVILEGLRKGLWYKEHAQK